MDPIKVLTETFKNGNLLVYNNIIEKFDEYNLKIKAIDYKICWYYNKTIQNNYVELLNLMTELNMFIKFMTREIIENKEPFSRKDLKINGKMLMEIGFEFGPSIGKALDILLGYVQENPELNNATQLKVIAHGILLSGEAE